MRALVVVESVFGTTRDAAGAVADGLSAHLPVEVRPVEEAPATPGDDVTLLVLGGPTHVLGMTRRSTRMAAARRYPGRAVAVPLGLREYLAGLRRADPGHRVEAAVFDTRVKAPVPGSAARAAARRLRRRGYDVSAVTTFWVGDVPGPLTAGQLERARRWGDALGAEHVTRQVPR